MHDDLQELNDYYENKDQKSNSKNNTQTKQEINDFMNDDKNSLNQFSS